MCYSDFNIVKYVALSTGNKAVGVERMNTKGFYMKMKNLLSDRV